MNKDLDLSLVWFKIRKATPKLYDRLSVYKQRDETYKITITSTEKDEWNENELNFIAGWNHEFVHVLLGEFVSYDTCDKYDDYLKLFSLYDMGSIKKCWY